MGLGQWDQPLQEKVRVFTMPLFLGDEPLGGAAALGSKEEAGTWALSWSAVVSAQGSDAANNTLDRNHPIPSATAGYL